MELGKKKKALEPTVRCKVSFILGLCVLGCHVQIYS